MSEEFLPRHKLRLSSKMSDNSGFTLGVYFQDDTWFLDAPIGSGHVDGSFQFAVTEARGRQYLADERRRRVLHALIWTPMQSWLSSAPNAPVAPILELIERVAVVPDEELDVMLWNAGVRYMYDQWCEVQHSHDTT